MTSAKRNRERETFDGTPHFKRLLTKKIVFKQCQRTERREYKEKEREAT